MNKPLFFTGLGIILTQTVVALFVYLNQFSVSEGTANMIVLITIVGSLSIASIVLMILGAIEK